MSNKQFTLSEEEKLNLEGRQKAEGYVVSVLARLVKGAIQEDMQDYVNNVVKKRLDLKPEDLITVDIDTGKIEVIEPDKKSSLILPNYAQQKKINPKR